jgi:hypothetical protein
MYLSARREAITIPEYSLTGDLLSFMRCHRQYRYQNGSSLPPARPVQLWFGEFVHGVMEMAYTMWQAKKYPLPWPSTPIEWNARLEPSTLRENDIGELGRRVENTLAVQGKSARNAAARQSAYSRVTAAINLIGPHLFPLVAFAEEPLTGSRSLPHPREGQELRARRYGLTGVADVLTEITMNTVAPDNLIRAAIESELQKCGLATPDSYEVIVDYKGAARPDPNEDYWKQHDWQVQTYAWLRGRKAAAKPVVAGILLYVNELLPGPDDMRQMARSFQKGTLEIAPTSGTADFNTLNLWRDGVAGAPNLSAAFRIQRSLRVIPVTEDSQARALAEFDKVVLEIESNVTNEVRASDISEAWTPNCRDAATCVACDFKSFCPSPADAGSGFKIKPPVAP